MDAELVQLDAVRGQLCQVLPTGGEDEHEKREQHRHAGRVHEEDELLLEQLVELLLGHCTEETIAEEVVVLVCLVRRVVADLGDSRDVHLHLAEERFALVRELERARGVPEMGRVEVVELIGQLKELDEHERLWRGLDRRRGRSHHFCGAIRPPPAAPIAAALALALATFSALDCTGALATLATLFLFALDRRVDDAAFRVHLQHPWGPAYPRQQQVRLRARLALDARAHDVGHARLGEPAVAEARRVLLLCFGHQPHRVLVCGQLHLPRGAVALLMR